MGRVFKLKKKWIVHAGHEENDAAIGPDATDADDLDRQIHKLKAVKKKTTGPPARILDSGKASLKMAGVLFFILVAQMKDQGWVHLMVGNRTGIERELRKVVLHHATFASLRQALLGPLLATSRPIIIARTGSTSMLAYQLP